MRDPVSKIQNLTKPTEYIMMDEDNDDNDDKTAKKTWSAYLVSNFLAVKCCFVFCFSRQGFSVALLFWSYVDQSSLKLRDLFASVSLVLKFKACATTICTTECCITGFMYFSSNPAEQSLLILVLYRSSVMLGGCQGSVVQTVNTTKFGYRFV